MQGSITLTPRQRRAAKYLALGSSQRAASRRLGVDERTLRRWITDVPGFKEHVEELRGLDSTVEDATDVLLDLLHSKDERVRLAAARELRRAPMPNPKAEDEDADLLSGWS